MTIGNGLRTVPAGDAAAPPYTKKVYNWDAQLTFTGKPMRNATGRYSLEENFLQIPAAIGVISAALTNADASHADNTAIILARANANMNFEITGTNADIADFSWSGINGGLLLETGSADNDQVIVHPHLLAKHTAWASVLWGTENQVVWEAQLMSTAVITPILVWAGLKLTSDPTTATDDNQVFFKFDTDVASETTIHCIYSIAGTDVTVDSGITYAAATEYNLRIEIDSDRIAHFFINDAEVATSTALTDNIDLIPYVGVQQLGSGDSSLVLCYEKISRILFE